MDEGEIDEERLLTEPSYFVDRYIGVTNDDPDVPNEVFDYQKEFMDHPSNRKAFVSGRRVGKSRTAAWMALYRAATYENAEILITAKAQRQSAELFNQIKKEIRTSKIGREDWGLSRSTRTEINFTNGSRIKVVPVGRDGSNIRGFGVDLLIVDEAAFIRDEIFQEVLSPMLAVGESTFMLLSTPFGKKGYLYRMWDKATKADDKTNDPDTDWFAQHVPTSANPLIPDSFIEEQRETLTREQFRQEMLGEFIETANSFFTREEVLNCAYQPRDDDDDSWTVTRNNRVPAYLGVDLAGSGSDLTVFIAVDADGNLFHIEGKDISLTRGMERVEELESRYTFDRIMIDQTSIGEGTVEQLRSRLGHKVEGFKFTNETKQSLYTTLKNYFQEGNLSFEFAPGKDEEENQMVSELLALESGFTPGGKTSIEHPPGGHDDYADALALATWASSQKSYAASDEETMRPFSMGSIE